MNSGSKIFNNEELILSSTYNSDGFPFIRTNQPVFPEGNFSIEWRFKYLTSNYGTGISITDVLPINRQTTHPDVNHFIFGSWVGGLEKTSLNIIVCPKDNENCTNYPSPIISDGLDFYSYNTVKIDFINGVYKLYYNNEFKFESAKTTRIPKYIWIGNPLNPATKFDWSSFAIDYIHITKLPDILDVPHFSQLNSSWKNEKLGTSSSTIGGYGCAITSTTMVLNYYGYTKTPLGLSMNPSNLNKYLIDNNGYNDGNMLVWSSISKMVEEIKKKDNTYKDLPSLEFSYSNYSEDLIKTDQEATTPGIVQIVINDKGTPKWSDDNLHFVVSEGMYDNAVYVKDPLSLVSKDSTISANYKNKTYRKLARFLKSYTDLSYIWLYLYNLDANVIAEINGQQTGVNRDGVSFNEIEDAQYYEEGNIYNQDEGLSLGGYKVLMMPKPTSGEYKFTFSGIKNSNIKFEMRTYKKDSSESAFLVDKLLDNEGFVDYSLSYNSRIDSPEPILEEIIKEEPVTFDSIRQFINDEYEAKNIKTKGLKNLLINFLDLSEKFNEKGKARLAQFFLDQEIWTLEKLNSKLINTETSEYLIEMIEELRENL